MKSIKFKFSISVLLILIFLGVFCVKITKMKINNYETQLAFRKTFYQHYINGDLDELGSFLAASLQITIYNVENEDLFSKLFITDKVENLYSESRALLKENTNYSLPEKIKK